MESHAVKNVIVQIHHVIMSMDALACRVRTKTFYFEIECVFQNKQTKKNQKLINLYRFVVHIHVNCFHCKGTFSKYGENK